MEPFGIVSFAETALTALPCLDGPGLALTALALEPGSAVILGQIAQRPTLWAKGSFRLEWRGRVSERGARSVILGKIAQRPTLWAKGSFRLEWRGRVSERGALVAALLPSGARARRGPCGARAGRSGWGTGRGSRGHAVAGCCGATGSETLWVDTVRSSVGYTRSNRSAADSLEPFGFQP